MTKTHRQSFYLRPTDQANITRIRESHNLRTDTDAVRLALALADKMGSIIESAKRDRDI